MNQLSTIVRRRIEAQGFVCLDDHTIDGINYALRISPAVCITWVAVGTALASHQILWALVPFAILGAILPGHPFDLLYYALLRGVMNRERIPSYPLPRRLSCLFASAMISLAAWSFQAGHSTLAYGLGLSMVLFGGINVTTGFCVPSFFYGLVFGRPACRKKNED